LSQPPYAQSQVNRIAEEYFLCDFRIYSYFFLQALTKRIGSYIKLVLRLQTNPELGGKQVPYAVQKTLDTGESRYPVTLRCLNKAKVAGFRVMPGMTTKNFRVSLRTNAVQEIYFG
jgi:hypothetical protein